MSKRINDIDKQYIRDHYKVLTDEKLAKILGCSTETVRRHRVKMGLSKGDATLNKADDKLKSYSELAESDELKKANLYRRELDNSSRGKRLRILLGEDYEYFADEWVAFHIQLPDLTHTEQVNIEQLVMLRLRVDENQKSYRKYLKMKDNLVESHGDPVTWDEDDRNDPDKAFVMANFVEIDKTISDFNTEYQRLLDKLQTLEKTLNVTREQRERSGKVQDQNFFSLCKSFESKKTRKQEGMFAEYARISTEKKKDQLRESVQYADGEFMPQLLDSETVNQMDKNERQNQ